MDLVDPMPNKHGYGGNLVCNGTQDDSHVIQRAKTYSTGAGPPLPRAGNVPVVNMLIHWGANDEQSEVIRVLLDSGSTIPLLSLSWVKPLTIPIARRKHPKRVEDFAGNPVQGAGEYYTFPLLLQHRRHFTRQTFEVAPMAEDYDAILPNWWIDRHPRSQSSKDLFTSPDCRRHCTREAAAAISFEWDEDVLSDPDAGVLGVVCAAPTESELKAAIDRVPSAFKAFTPLMTTEAAMILPEHGPYDHAIDLKEGSVPPWGPIYPLNETELSELRLWLEKMTKMGAVRPSKSSCSSPMLFVPKGHGRGLRLCIDYRGINKITVPNRYPLPNMDELSERVRGSQWFTKLDLKNGYHLVRIKKGDEWKTAFRCRYGLFEYTVMPFGLVNAPATFQSMINHIFRDLLDQGVLAFMDDLLIHAADKDEHDRLVLEVLGRLEKNRLCIAPDKCEWGVKRVEFLGYMISGEGLEMTDEKIQTIKDIEPINSQKDVQHFLGFAGFYRRFIRGYSKICLPLTDSTALRPSEWRPTPEIHEAQRKLIQAFTTAPTLTHLIPSCQP
jgi:hypothetical protein